MDYKRIIKILEEKNIDAIITSDGYNMRYISGFAGATGFLYISKDARVILTDSRYTIQAKEEAPDFQVIEISSEKNYKAWLSDLVNEHKSFNIGFEDKSISYSEYSLLSKLTDDINLVELGDELNKLRIIKTDKEIEYIAKAEAIGDKAYTAILDFIRPGMTELEVAAKLEYTMKCEGAENLSFDTIVASGINSSKPHAVPSNKKIEKGDFVTMDFGCMVNGYCSDMTRTLVVGKANEKQKEVYNTVLTAQKRALELIKAGENCHVVDFAARGYIADCGYGDCFGHGLGHSVGLFIHEDPRLSPSCKEVLEENVLMTVEPGIYIEGFGGVRIEDLVVVTKDGYRNLTSSPKELISL